MKHQQYDAHVQHSDFDRSTFLVMPEWFLLEFVHFFNPRQYDTKNQQKYINWSFSIGYFERYLNVKSDYLELLLSVSLGIDKLMTKIKVSEKSRSNFKVKVTWSKNYEITWKVLSQRVHIWNMKAMSLTVHKLWPRSRLLGQKSWNGVKGLVTRNAYMQYESPSSSRLKVMAKVTVFKK